MILPLPMNHILTEFSENWFSHFCIILQTNEQTNWNWCRWKHNLFGGGNNCLLENYILLGNTLYLCTVSPFLFEMPLAVVLCACFVFEYIVSNKLIWVLFMYGIDQLFNVACFDTSILKVKKNSGATGQIYDVNYAVLFLVWK